MAISSSVLSLSNAQNINISAYRVLYILLVLVRYKNLSSTSLNRHLIENPLIARCYNNETLSKYINTLRIAGCNIPKAHNRNNYTYELLNTPFPLKLSPEEITLLGKIAHLLTHQPDEKLLKNYHYFLSCLDCSLDINSKLSTPVFRRLENKNTLTKLYKSYCTDGLNLYVEYRFNESSSLKKLQIEPQEVIQKSDHILLLALNCLTQEHLFLNTNRIEKINQIQSKKSQKKSVTTSTFILYDQLAKDYRLRPDETTIYQGSRELHIKSRVKDPELFINRLMAYGDSCQLLSPERLRKQVKERIVRLIHYLQKPATPTFMPEVI